MKLLEIIFYTALQSTLFWPDRIHSYPPIDCFVLHRWNGRAMSPNLLYAACHDSHNPFGREDDTRLKRREWGLRKEVREPDTPR